MPLILIIGLIILFFFGWAGIGAVVFWIYHNAFNVIDIILYSFFGIIGFMILIFIVVVAFYSIKEFSEWIIKKIRQKKNKWQNKN